jgi:type I restriction enzyme S subunit
MTLRVHPDQIVAQLSNGVLGVHPSWRRVRVGEIAEVLNGFAFPSSAFAATGTMPLIRIRDVGRTNTDTWYSGPFEPQYVVQPGSLIVGMDGDFRAAEWKGPPALLNQRVCTISVRDPSLYDPDFLRYALPGYLEAVNRYTSAVTVKHLSSETVKELPLPLPPRSEQDRIVTAIEEQFSRLDAGVGTLERVRQNLKRMRAAVFYQLDACAAQSSASKSLREVAEFIVDGDHNPPKRTAIGIPYLTAKHVKRGSISVNGATCVSLEDFARLSRRYKPRGGDVVVTCVGTLGETAVVPEGLIFAADRNLAAIRPAPSVLPRYLEAILRSPRQQEMLTTGSGSTAQPHLYLKDLRSLPIPVPSVGIQEELLTALEEQLSIVDRLESEIEKSVGRSTGLRSSILSAAFSGRLVSQDPDDEAATILLGRISADRASSNGRELTSRRTRAKGTT